MPVPKLVKLTSSSRYQSILMRPTSTSCNWKSTDGQPSLLSCSTGLASGEWACGFSQRGADDNSWRPRPKPRSMPAPKQKHTRDALYSAAGGTSPQAYHNTCIHDSPGIA